MRAIPGVTEKQEYVEDEFKNGEFRENKVVIQNRQDEFNSQDKFDKATFDVK